jgi:DNA-binding MarR family transcriptional regulator
LRADISLLFNFFVTSQRIRRLLSDAMAPSGMKPDEYAVYSLLFEKPPMTATEMSEFLGMPLTTVLDYLKAMSGAGHLERLPHPSDGRAVQLRLSSSGVSAHRRAHHYFDLAYRRIVESLPVPIARVRLALAALDDAAQRVAEAPDEPGFSPAPTRGALDRRRAPTRRRLVTRPTR